MYPRVRVCNHSDICGMSPDSTLSLNLDLAKDLLSVSLLGKKKAADNVNPGFHKPPLPPLAKRWALIEGWGVMNPPLTLNTFKGQSWCPNLFNYFWIMVQVTHSIPFHSLASTTRWFCLTLVNEAMNCCNVARRNAKPIHVYFSELAMEGIPEIPEIFISITFCGV